MHNNDDDDSNQHNNVYMCQLVISLGGCRIVLLCDVTRVLGRIRVPARYVQMHSDGIVMIVMHK